MSEIEEIRERNFLRGYIEMELQKRIDANPHNGDVDESVWDQEMKPK